jgi:hypothetical protein
MEQTELPKRRVLNTCQAIGKVKHNLFTVHFPVNLFGGHPIRGHLVSFCAIPVHQQYTNMAAMRTYGAATIFVDLRFNNGGHRVFTYCIVIDH